MRSWLTRLRAEMARAPAPVDARPFILITPLGLRRRKRIVAALRNWNVRPGEIVTIPDWDRASTAIYTRKTDDASLRKALFFESLWRNVCKNLKAEQWILRQRDYRVVHGRKYELRAALGMARPGLHLFHLPDPDEIAEEARALAVFRHRPANDACAMSYPTDNFSLHGPSDSQRIAGKYL